MVVLDLWYIPQIENSFLLWYKSIKKVLLLLQKPYSSCYITKSWYCLGNVIMSTGQARKHYLPRRVVLELWYIQHIWNYFLLKYKNNKKVLLLLYNPYSSCYITNSWYFLCNSVMSTSKVRKWFFIYCGCVGAMVHSTHREFFSFMV